MTISFDSGIVKVLKDGTQVLSHYLDKGEKMLDGRTYAEVEKDLGKQAQGEVSSVEQRPGEGADATETKDEQGAASEKEQQDAAAKAKADADAAAAAKAKADADKAKQGTK
jgi:hypothetical protein